ncbi:MAG: 1-acyl-sn-glycerol-3-phosphate acyltransferase [bacterium]|nr:1-acyl-sn-glycerol-3-phosphate acyltransferase [bacterium]
MGIVRRIRGILRPISSFVLLPVTLAIASICAIVHSLAGASPRDAHIWYRGVAQLGLRLAGTELEVHGLEKLKPGQAYVVVANHESNMDPYTLLAGLPELVLRFVAKKQIMNIPILGHALRMTGNIRVDRTAARSDVERLRTNMSRRNEDVSILFFAEGTRDRTGAFREFRKGAFATAQQFDLPVLPVAVAGTYAVWRPESPVIREGPVVVEVGEPIPVEGVEWSSRDQLRKEAHKAVGELRRRARKRLREKGVDPGGVD